MLSTSRFAVRAFACAVVTSFLSVSAHGAFLSTMGISDNTTANAIGEAQISIEIMRELAERLEKTTNQLRDARTQLAAG